MTEHPLNIQVTPTETVSALRTAQDNTRAAFVFAHGAGAGMTHPFMAGFAGGLAEYGIATLRFQFPYMERGSRRPDAPPLARAAVRAAVEAAAREFPALPLFAGGKSYGGRMTSQAQAESPLPGVRGLIFVGFPLHPAGKPSSHRAAHLAAVRCPMLFLQGSRDALAELPRIIELMRGMVDRATLRVLDNADHSFQVRARSVTNNEEVRRVMIDETARWILEQTTRAES